MASKVASSRAGSSSLRRARRPTAPGRSRRCRARPRPGSSARGPTTTSSASKMWPMHSSTDHSPGAGRVRSRSPASTMRARIAAGVSAWATAGSSSPRAASSDARYASGSRPGRWSGSCVLPLRFAPGHSSSLGSRRARSRSEPSASATRQTQCRHPARHRRPGVAAGSAARAYSSRTRRGTARRRARAAGGEDRLIEPVGIDRVVDVVHRIELLRPDRRPGADRAAEGTSPRSTRARPNVAGGTAKTASNSFGIRVGAPRSSSRTQSMWTQRRARHRRRWNSVRRRAQTRRKPTTTVVPTSSAPTLIGATTATSAARTSQTMPRSAYHDRSNPRLAE